jgi:hypothetical protein
VNAAFDMACSVVARFGVVPPLGEDQIDDLCAVLGLHVKDAPANLPVPAFRVDHTIAVRLGLCPCLRKWIKTHELGHYLLHAGDQTCEFDASQVVKQERQADTFAGWLLCGIGWWGMPAWEIADQYNLPESRVAAWLAERERELG